MTKPPKATNTGTFSSKEGPRNVRGDTGGRIVALLSREVFCADPLELHGHELERAGLAASLFPD